MSESKDFKLVKELLLEFIKKKEVKSRLSHVVANEYNDWEKWFQIEFEYFLLNEKYFHTRRELKANSDKRSKLNRFYMFVDLIFRKPNTAKDQYIYLEFKRAVKATTLVKEMLNDITKVNSIVQSHYVETEIKQRSFWCVGFYHSFHTLTVDRAKKEISQYSKIFHEPVYLCSCRGASHYDECLKIGVVII
ncbi:hypothetical protein [Klebsiella sp. BIGb0407]|uniref:hypothetical protein n=1 Tax=Klebsiella sp. BIGb0407 TaxID=2940603 RepID=UPI002167E750|nr:hypothetical protein [Klebsiella sp. BIGb0407]MCS3429538.1 hypothetical protein [Klebsiella sp. BIGb0407]